MGIKTLITRLGNMNIRSEKPPHHMGIKTLDTHPASKVLVL